MSNLLTSTAASKFQRLTRFKRLIGKSFSLLLLATSICCAQTNTGQIRGIVRDSTGAVLPDCAVSVMNAANNIKYDLVTDTSWHNSVFDISSSDRATLLAGVSFDASVWELWPYVCHGASLDIPPDEMRTSPDGLRDWIQERAVTISFVPTPVAEPMLALEWRADTKLRMLLTGGDRLHSWPASSLPFAVVNNYGPTQNAVVTTSGLVSRNGEAAASAPGVGEDCDAVGRDRSARGV